MNKIKYLYEDLSLAEILSKGLFKHADDILVRFGVSDSGRLLVGDAYDVLHADICRCALAIGDDNQMFAGVAILNSTDPVWELRFQGLHCKHPQDLAARLSTWSTFVAGVSTKLRTSWLDI